MKSKTHEQMERNNVSTTYYDYSIGAELTMVGVKGQPLDSLQNQHFGVRKVICKSGMVLSYDEA